MPGWLSGVGDVDLRESSAQRIGLTTSLTTVVIIDTGQASNSRGLPPIALQETGQVGPRPLGHKQASFENSPMGTKASTG
jgi:hypothetical protein